MKERIRIYDKRWMGTGYLLQIVTFSGDIKSWFYTESRMKEKLSELSPHAILPGEWPEPPEPILHHLNRGW